MGLEERIENEFKEAMKKRDAVKVSVLRMLKAAINNAKLEQNKKDFTDEGIVKILQKQVKQHRDSIEQFTKGNRADLVDKEKKELEILLTYMPEQLSEDEIKKIVRDAISELGASGPKDTGRVIKAVMGKAKGRAEGKIVSHIVKTSLEQS